MLSGLYGAATAMAAAELGQEIIARNLAHLDVPGFRRSVPVSTTFESVLQQTEASAMLSPNVGVSVSAQATDFSEGTMQHTGRSLDFAINGDGFFVVDAPDGPRYTRNGVFQVSPDGELVTSDGRTVQGDGGPIVIPPNTSVHQIQAATDGTITANGEKIGRLRVVAFADNSQLIPASTFSFAAPAGVQPDETEVTVQQGVRELSNVSAVSELVQMIANSRQFEASQRAMTTIARSLEQQTNPQQG